MRDVLVSKGRSRKQKGREEGERKRERERAVVECLIVTEGHVPHPRAKRM